jgi:hypothetical protein
MTDKERYRELCVNEPSIPIYSRDWWLDCVCGEEKWDVLLYRNGENIEAAMPYYIPCKGIISMPLYTQTLGIWFNPIFKDQYYSRDLYRKQTICKDFIVRLPVHGYFLQNFHYSFTDWLPFYWNRFRQTTRYTYVLPDIKNPNELRNSFSNNILQNIHKAKNKYQLTVKRNVPTDLFLEINTQTYQRQGMKPYHHEMLRKLIELSRSRNLGDIWGAFDQAGQLHAAIFVVWQENCAYYIAGGSDSLGRKSGAHLLVLWEAICDTSNFSTSFDFEGSMILGVERVFRSFGAIQKPYFVIEKGKMNLIKRIRLKIKFLKNHDKKNAKLHR